jgi:hypothetical protein
VDTVRCASCGKQNDLEDQTCVHCGQPVAGSISSSQVTGPPPFPVPPLAPLPPPTVAPIVMAPASNGPATAALVLGIVGVVLFFVPVIGFVCAILGVVLGAVGIGRANAGAMGKGQAIAGVILGAVGILLPLALLGVFLSGSNHVVRQIPTSIGP